MLVPNNYSKGFRQSHEDTDHHKTTNCATLTAHSLQPDCAIWIPENPDVKYRLRHTQAQFCFGAVLRSDLWVKVGDALADATDKQIGN